MHARVLILCTGNSCRSQMAEGILRAIDPELEVFSAGVNPAPRVSSKALAVMKEIGISLEGAYPKHVDQFLNDSFDYVVTVCDHAKETCPVFYGKVKHRVHMGFEDPGDVSGTKEEMMDAHRRVRDEMREKLAEFYHSRIAHEPQ